MSNGPYSGRALRGFRRLDYEAAVEALARAEFFVADLVAHGAVHAIRGLSAGFLSSPNGRCENLPLLALQLGLVARDRHVADRALVLDVRADSG